MSDENINPSLGPNGEAEWGIANYIDFDGNTHEFYDNNVDAFAVMKDEDYSDIDLVTIWWVDADDGSVQFGRLEGPFEDYEDLDEVVDTYFETGS